MRWRAWYRDEVYDSQRTEWKDLPSEGLQCLVVFYLEGTTYYDGADWYWLYEGEFGFIGSGDEWGTHKEPPAHVACKSCLKKGTRLDDDEFAAIQAIAKSEMIAV